MKQALENGDASALRRILTKHPKQANALIRWGTNDSIHTHPLHYVSDLLFEKRLPKTRALPLIDALIKAGADLNFQPKPKSDTPLIGAASLGAEEVGLRLIEAGADPSIRGIFGETALHWAALLGEAKLVRKLIPGANLELKDEKYNSTPLGWAIHGFSNPPAGSNGDQLKVAQLLIKAGAKPNAQQAQILESQRESR